MVGCSKEEHPFLWSSVQSCVLTRTVPGTLGAAPALQAMGRDCQAFRDNGSGFDSFRSDSPNSSVTKPEVAVLGRGLGTTLCCFASWGLAGGLSAAKCEAIRFSSGSKSLREKLMSCQLCAMNGWHFCYGGAAHS